MYNIVIFIHFSPGGRRGRDSRGARVGDEGRAGRNMGLHDFDGAPAPLSSILNPRRFAATVRPPRNHGPYPASNAGVTS